MVHVRLATTKDVPALRVLVERAYRGDSARQGWTHEADLLHDERTSDAELESAIASDQARVLVAERDGALLGTVTITEVGNSRTYLGMLCVDPDVQAEGLGRTLIAEAESAALRAFDARFMEMTVIDARVELIAWYERRGYARTGEIRPFPYGGNDGLRMAVLERSLR